jgi:DNA topoisomerase I
VMKFPGFTVLYTEAKEETHDDKESEALSSQFARIIPEVRKGDTLKLLSVNPEQKFTQPPPRFSEASLVRELEENGIGRPSTYATIISTIQDREYVTLEKQKFIPTELGSLVTDLLVKNFPRILDIAFTAQLETELDRIAEGKEKRLDILNNFYAPFTEELKKAHAAMRNVKKEEIPTDIVCKKCGSPMVIKWGRNGKFLACSNYPACKNTMNFTEDPDGKIIPAEETTTDQVCPLCGRPLVVKQGRYGKFLACSGYPECKYTAQTDSEAKPEKPAPEFQQTDQICEKCGRPMVLKQGRYGKFLACSGYPECKNIIKMPRKKEAPPPEITDILCEKCGRPMAIRQGRYGKFLACTGYPECKNIKKYKEPDKNKG